MNFSITTNAVTGNNIGANCTIWQTLLKYAMSTIIFNNCSLYIYLQILLQLLHSFTPKKVSSCPAFMTRCYSPMMRCFLTLMLGCEFASWWAGAPTFSAVDTSWTILSRTCVEVINHYLVISNLKRKAAALNNLHVSFKKSYVLQVQQHIQLHDHLSQPPSWKKGVDWRLSERKKNWEGNLFISRLTDVNQSTSRSHLSNALTSTVETPSFSVALLWASLLNWPWTNVSRQAANDGRATGISSHSTDRWSYLTWREENSGK